MAKVCVRYPNLTDEHDKNEIEIVEGSSVYDNESNTIIPIISENESYKEAIYESDKIDENQLLNEVKILYENIPSEINAFIVR